MPPEQASVVMNPSSILFIAIILIVVITTLIVIASRVKAAYAATYPSSPKVPDLGARMFLITLALSAFCGFVYIAWLITIHKNDYSPLMIGVASLELLFGLGFSAMIAGAVTHDIIKLPISDQRPVLKWISVGFSTWFLIISLLAAYTGSYFELSVFDVVVFWLPFALCLGGLLISIFLPTVFAKDPSARRQDTTPALLALLPFFILFILSAPHATVFPSGLIETISKGTGSCTSPGMIYLPSRASEYSDYCTLIRVDAASYIISAFALLIIIYQFVKYGKKKESVTKVL